MELSIIIRTFNRLEYLIRTIVSIDERSGLDKSDYEIIVVDQGSSDGTFSWLNYAERGYYPIVPIFMDKNIGDGLGMQVGIEGSKGEFIAQNDDDVKLVSDGYYSRLIEIYEALESKGEKVCALGGSHIQGFEIDSAPFRFAKAREGSGGFLVEYSSSSRSFLYPVAWTTASFIFRRQFAEDFKFGKGMCNSWCGEWFDRGCKNFISKDINFWHIDSGETGAHVQKQYDKFPEYEYVFRHYKNFIKKSN